MLSAAGRSTRRCPYHPGSFRNVFGAVKIFSARAHSGPNHFAVGISVNMPSGRESRSRRPSAENFASLMRPCQPMLAISRLPATSQIFISSGSTETRRLLSGLNAMGQARPL